MTRSESINELAAALAQAQGAIQNAKKDSENPHFRSKYADLAAIWDACRTALAAHGLSVVQSPRLIAAGEGLWLVEVETVLLHQSGQSISDVLAVPMGPPALSAQGVGSAITYARRYALAAFVGVAPEDDDAQSTMPVRDLRDERPAKKASPPMPAKIPSAPGPGPHKQRVKVLGIVQRPADASGRIKFVISGGDQKTYQTLKLEDATTAKQAQEAGLPIELTYRNTADGRIIDAVRELSADSQEPPL